MILIDFDNKTLIILIVGICAVIGLLNGQSDISNFALGGLVGYLTKDMSDKVIDYIQNSPDCPKKEEEVILVEELEEGA